MPSVIVCSGYYNEVGISDCMYGCKIVRCECCGHEKTTHNRTYGCQKGNS